MSGCNNVPQYAPGSIANAPPGAVTQVQPTDKISHAAGIVDAVAGTNLKSKLQLADRLVNADSNAVKK